MGASWERTVKITTEIVETFRSKISTEFGTSTEKPVRIEVPPPKQGDIRNAFLYPLFERYYVEAIVLSGPSKDGYATERKSIAKFPMLRLVNWKVGWDDHPKEQKKTSAARSLGDGPSMRPSADRASISDRFPIIVIDPGHGGDRKIGGSSPNNATGPDGLLEKDLTLDLARRLRAILSPAANVALTRDGDVNLSLADRARAARDRRADLFLSIHLNGFKDPQTDGTEVWVAREANPQSRAFAQAVLQRVQGVTGVRDRGVRQSDLGVILPNRHDPRTAACLLEVAFLTNPAQALRLAGAAYKQRIAEAMATAVRQHLRAAAGAERGMAAALDRGTTAVVSKPIPLAFFRHKFDEYINKRKQPPFKLRIHKNKASITFDQEFAELHGLKKPMEFNLGHLEVDLPGPFNPNITLNDINSAGLQLTVRAVDQSPGVKVVVPEFAFKLTFETGGTEIEINNFPNVDLSKLEIDIRMKLVVEKGRLSVIPDVATSIRWSINNLPDGIYDVENKIKNILRSKLIGAFNDDLRRKVGEQLTRWLLGGLYEVRALSVGGQGITIDYLEPKPGSVIQPFPEKPQPKATPGNLSKIDHIVALMMENRSFDHMLGYLSLHGGRKDIDGLKGKEKNVYKGREFRSFPLADTPFPESPCHDYACVLNQTANGMGGFVADFASRYEKSGVDPGKVMGYYRAEHVPVYDVLAREFGVCDRWFCTHPGATWPNRFQSLSGRLERDGFGRFQYDNPEPVLFTPSHAKTIFDHLEDRKVDWRYYEHGFCFLRLYSRWTLDVERIRPARDDRDGFFVAAREGRLPSVSFIDPKFIDEPPGNDDHPPADVRNGQRLVAQIVSALMNGPRWNKTLLIITYDEHGGFFDHVVPPRAADVSGIDRYGPRVPALIVAPWVERGKASHTVFDHCSILKTIVRRFCAANPPDLGERANKANDVGELLTLAKARTDRPKIPMPAGTWQFSAESFAGAAVPFSRDFHSLLATMRRRYPVPSQQRTDRAAATHALEAGEWSSLSIPRR